MTKPEKKSLFNQAEVWWSPHFRKGMLIYLSGALSFNSSSLCFSWNQLVKKRCNEWCGNVLYMLSWIQKSSKYVWMILLWCVLKKWAKEMKLIASNKILISKSVLIHTLFISVPPPICLHQPRLLSLLFMLFSF